MTPARVLVTGSMGCLGAWTLYHLVKAGQQAISFDLSSHRSRLDLLLDPAEQTAIHFVTGDLTDFQAVLSALQTHQVTHIIHLGALQVPFCRANPVLGAQVNVVGTVNLFEASKQAGIRHMAYASSIAVYGAADAYPDPVPHEAALSPSTLYGVYKQANEGTAQVYWADYGLSSCALRPYTVYGLGRDQGLTSEPTQALLAVAAGRPFEISFGGVMQFQWASDVAQQFIQAALQPQEGARVYNLGGPGVSVEEFVALTQQVRPDAAITVGDKRLPFPTRFDDSALQSAVPTVYSTPLRLGIAQTIAGFERNLAAGRIS